MCHRDDAGMVKPGAVEDLVLLDRDFFGGAGVGGAAVWLRSQPVVVSGRTLLNTYMPTG